MTKIKYLVLGAAIMLLSACANLGTGIEKPEIHLVSIKPLASENLEQRFSLGLRITNPNALALPINGLSYSLSLQGHKLLSGAASTETNIPAFGNTLVDLESGTNLLGGLGVISELLRNPERNFEYSLELKIHTSLWYRPITLIESGEIAMDND